MGHMPKLYVRDSRLDRDSNSYVEFEYGGLCRSGDPPDGALGEEKGGEV